MTSSSVVQYGGRWFGDTGTCACVRAGRCDDRGGRYSGRQAAPSARRTVRSSKVSLYSTCSLCELVSGSMRTVCAKGIPRQVLDAWIVASTAWRVAAARVMSSQIGSVAPFASAAVRAP